MSLNRYEQRRQRGLNMIILCIVGVILLLAVVGCRGPLAPDQTEPQSAPLPIWQQSWVGTYHVTTCQGPSHGSLAGVCAALAAHPDPYPFQLEHTPPPDPTQPQYRGRMALGVLWLPTEWISMGVNYAELTANGIMNTTGLHIAVSASVWRVDQALRGSVGLVYSAPDGGMVHLRAQMEGVRR